MIDESYVAGFFDGEGHSYINNKGLVIIEICNTYEKVLKLINNKYGGTVKPFNYKPRGLIEKYKTFRKPQWRYRLFRQNQVLKFLSDIEPFLVIKPEIVNQQIIYLKRPINKGPQRIIKKEKKENE